MPKTSIIQNRIRITRINRIHKTKGRKLGENIWDRSRQTYRCKLQCIETSLLLTQPNSNKIVMWKKNATTRWRLGWFANRHKAERKRIDTKYVLQNQSGSQFDIAYMSNLSHISIRKPNRNLDNWSNGSKIMDWMHYIINSSTVKNPISGTKLWSINLWRENRIL